MSISSNIKYLREKHGMSQQEFGELFGVSDKAVSTWELGYKTPRMGTIEKISQHFNVAKSSIIDGDLTDSSEATASELDEYLEQLRKRPEMKMLFSLTKDATKEDVEKAVKIIEALLGKEG